MNQGMIACRAASRDTRAARQAAPEDTMANADRYDLNRPIPQEVLDAHPAWVFAYDEE